MSYTVAQNTSFLTMASVLQKVISFVYFTIIANIIGVENTGVYFFAISFTTVFSIIADFGMTPVLTREAARFPNDRQKYVNNILTAKILFGFFAYGVVIFLANILNYPDLTKTMIYISGITMFFDNLHSMFYSVFRAGKNLIYESFGVVGSQAITLLIGSLALFLEWPLYWLILAYAIPSFLNFLYSSYFATKVYNLKYRLNLEYNFLKIFFLMAMPFALSGIIHRLYSFGDSILMSKLLSEKELGWWSVPYKITNAFQFIPGALAASVYPAMSFFYPNTKERLSELFVKSWRYLFIIVFPVSFGIIAVARPAILKLYGSEYLPSVSVLQVLLPSMIFIFLSAIISATLNASDRQKWQTWLLSIALAINMLLNITLLPRIGIMGAAISSLISNIILCLLGIMALRKFIIIPLKKLFTHAWSAFWQSAIMALLVFYLTPYFSIYVTIPLGVIIYLLLLFFTKTITKDTIEMVIKKTRV